MQLIAQPCEPKRRGAGCKKAPRVRLEREHTGHKALGVRYLFHCGDDSHMAVMHPIEIADSYGARTISDLG